ncbi:hypothetical protein NHQ30_003629 [Ciborinia camelliae]|nr:hypothetical protein NHQ30_003629 [Ciborinia camelliae]
MLSSIIPKEKLHGRLTSNALTHYPSDPTKANKMDELMELDSQASDIVLSEEELISLARAGRDRLAGFRVVDPFKAVQKIAHNNRLIFQQLRDLQQDCAKVEKKWLLLCEGSKLIVERQKDELKLYSQRREPVKVTKSSRGPGYEEGLRHALDFIQFLDQKLDVLRDVAPEFAKKFRSAEVQNSRRREEHALAELETCRSDLEAEKELSKQKDIQILNVVRKETDSYTKLENLKKKFDTYMEDWEDKEKCLKERLRLAEERCVQYDDGGMDELNEELSEVRRELNDKKDELSRVQGELKVAEDGPGSANEELERLKSSIDVQEFEVTNRLHAAELKLNAANRDLIILKDTAAKYDKLEEQHATLTRAHEDIVMEKDQLSREFDAYKHQIKEAQRESTETVKKMIGESAISHKVTTLRLTPEETNQREAILNKSNSDAMNDLLSKANSSTEVLQSRVDRLSHRLETLILDICCVFDKSGGDITLFTESFYSLNLDPWDSIEPAEVNPTNIWRLDAIFDIESNSDREETYQAFLKIDAMILSIYLFSLIARGVIDGSTFILISALTFKVSSSTNPVVGLIIFNSMNKLMEIEIEATELRNYLYLCHNHLYAIARQRFHDEKDPISLPDFNISAGNSLTEVANRILLEGFTTDVLPEGCLTWEEDDQYLVSEDTSDWLIFIKNSEKRMELMLKSFSNHVENAGPEGMIWEFSGKAFRLHDTKDKLWFRKMFRHQPESRLLTREEKDQMDWDMPDFSA